MAQTTAGIGHNDYPDDDFNALVMARCHLIRQRRAMTAMKKADYDEAKGQTNAAFAKFKDLGYTRKDVEELLVVQDMDDDEFIEAEAKRLKLFRGGGVDVPEGHQFDLVERLNDTADDQARAHAQGKRAGLKGDPGTPPDTVHPTCIQPWQAGWNDGQAILGAGLKRAEEIDAAAAKPVEPPVDPEDEEAGEDFDADEEARRLKRSGFMETSAEDDDQAAAA